MKTLVIGSGGREHALAWKLAQSDQVECVYVAPGNAGTGRENKLRNIAIAADDLPQLVKFAKAEAIDITVVGPEVPLVMGIVDQFQEAGLNCFGPSKAAAQLEGSKTFCKDFLARHSIPTARYQAFTDTQQAIDYLRQQNDYPIVIKADGLAAGKGVVIADNETHAIETVTAMLEGNVFGAAGRKVVIEEFLSGEEASFIVMVDGKQVLPLATSQDHKARDDGDRGPNTGGMGAYSPAPVISESLNSRIMKEIIIPTVDGMTADGHPYHGFLFAGLMIDAHGNPKVLEFNCRFGDPETQPIMMRLQSDLAMLCKAAIEQRLDQVDAQWDPRTALGVVMAAGGYPEHYQKGDVINGLDRLQENGYKVFHAGTAEVNGKIVTSGGRILCVTALGSTVREAQSNAYQGVQQIHWDQAYYRRDIGYRAVAREKSR